MKTLTIVLLCVGMLILPTILFAQDSTDFGPSMIGGAGVGYAVDGPDTRETFLYQFAGIRVAQLKAGAIYACYQHASIQGIAGVGGDGGKLILADKWTSAPDFTWLFGLGFLDNIKAIEDGTDLKTGLTAEGGITYDASEWLEIGVLGTAWDRGAVDESSGVSWTISFFAAVKNPLDLIPGLGD